MAPRLTHAVQDYILPPKCRKKSTAEEYAEMEKGRCNNGMNMLAIKAPREILRGKIYVHRAVEIRGRRRIDSRRKLLSRLTSSIPNAWGRSAQCPNTAHINATGRILTVNQAVA